MCGRTCCALCAPIYESAACYYDSINDEYKKPSYINSTDLSFIPSINLSPTEVLPVLVWDNVQNRPVIRPMIWGLIPPWTTGDYKAGIYATHNCRIENMMSSSLFSLPLKKGKRCVILCEGYYEWKITVGKHKQPYFIYKKQPNMKKVEDEYQWNSGEWSKTEGWAGPSLTCLAGLYSAFDFNKDQELNGTILSASVITMNSSHSVSHIHSRMPAILSTQEQIMDWLNVENVCFQEAINNLQPSDDLSCHEVSSEVNSSKNKSTTCNKPVDTRKQGGKQMSLTAFFKKPKKDEEKPPKRSKTD